MRNVLENVALWLAINVTIICVIILVEISEIEKPIWWGAAYPIAINILSGGLVSFFFYWLVVYVPERRKRRIIKSNLSKMYYSLKEAILYQVVFASIKGGRHDLQTDSDTIATLMTTDGFRRSFEGGREADEGFYAFENQMSDDTPEFREIILNFGLLAKQIEFILYNYTMGDDDLFNFFKRLELVLLSLQQSTHGYNESKSLCRFVYEIFSGWSCVDGYRGYDLIDKMITDI